MSLYKKKEDDLASAFTHLVDDSSSDESTVEVSEDQHPEEEVKSEPVAVTPVPRPCEANNRVVDISDDNDDESDCIILEDEVSQVDPIYRLSTRRKEYFRNATRKKRAPPIITPINQSGGDTSFNDDYEFNLKITLAGSYRQFRTTYRTKLQDSLQDLIDELKFRGKTLWLTFEDDDKLISLEESPHSLNLTPGTILNAIEISPEKMSSENKSKPIVVDDVDPDTIKVKLQDGHRKHIKEFTINKDDPIVRLKEFWSQEYGIDISLIKLCFDGDVLANNTTPEEADIDDGCVLDVLVTK